MKYKPEIYAKAFSEVLEITPEEKQGELAKKFIVSIRKKGDFAQIDKIIEALNKILVRKSKGKNIDIEFARTMPENIISKIKNGFAPEDSIKFYENKKLIAGTRVTVDGSREADFSLRKKLKKIFNTMN